MIENSRYTPAEDGTSLAYNVVGDGAALVFANGYTTSNFFWHSVHDHLLPHAKLVTWDYKGHGRSAPARSREGTTMRALVDDMARVMDAAGVECATLLGFSMGSQVVLEAWRRYPERIRGLVSVLGPYQSMLDTAIHPRIGGSLHQALRLTGPRRFTLLHHGAHAVLRLPQAHRLGRKLRIAGPAAPDEDLATYIRHFGQIHPPTVRRIGLAAQNHSAEDLLHSIDVPVLIVAGSEDLFSPPHLGEMMHARLPDSELITVPGATHMGLVEFPEIIGPAIERFLQRQALLE
jgi:pimeloyl-ACP methyl ester carboxylesterase